MGGSSRMNSSSCSVAYSSLITADNIMPFLLSLVRRAAGSCRSCPLSREPKVSPGPVKVTPTETVRRAEGGVQGVADEVNLGGERSDDAEGARLDGVFKDPGNDRLCFDTVKRAAGLPAL